MVSASASAEKTFRGIGDFSSGRSRRHSVRGMSTLTGGEMESSTNTSNANSGKRGKAGDPSPHVLKVDSVTQEVGNNRTLFKDLSLSFYHGAKIGVLGHNGSGKSSLLKILAGIDVPSDGSVSLVEKHLKVGYLEQGAPPEAKITKFF